MLTWLAAYDVTVWRMLMKCVAVVGNLYNTCDLDLLNPKS